MSTETSPKSKAGRPRGFDPEVALNAALEIFFRHGYEGASLDALTDAMGINRPSLYAAFGNKEQLFKTVIDRYVARHGKTLCFAMNAPTAREAIERLLREIVSSGCAGGPRGCLLVQGALACSPDSEAIRRELAQRRAATEIALRARFERALSEGDLPADTNAGALARYFTTVIQGLAVQASGGTTPADLNATVDIALQAWPAGSTSGRTKRRGR